MNKTADGKMHLEITVPKIKTSRLLSGTGDIEALRPAVHVEIVELSFGHVTERGSHLAVVVPGDGDVIVIAGDVSHHTAMLVVLVLGRPLDVTLAILAVAFSNNVGEGNNLVRGIVGAGEDLLVHDVGEDVLFAALALDDLGALSTGLDNLLGEGVCIGGRVVDQRAVKVLPSCNALLAGVGVVLGAPLKVLRVHRPGSSTPGIDGLDKVKIVSALFYAFS